MTALAVREVEVSGSQPAPRRVLIAVVAAKVVATVAVAGRYGPHRDELYYLAASRHLALGYVDFNPLIAVVARVVGFVAGESVHALRLTALAAGVLVIVVTAMTAREVGGSPKAELLAGLAVATSGFFLGANSLFQPVSFDQLAWVVCLYLAVRIVRRGEPGAWIALGLAVGVAFWTKYTIVALTAALLVGFLATPARARLRGPWPWAAASLALVLASPNLAWQAAHEWATLDFLPNQNAAVRSEYPPARYLVEQIVVVGPVAMVLSIIGFRWLWRNGQLRALAVAGLGVILWYLVLGGKSYYPLTAYPVLMAAGAVAVEGHLRRWATALTIGGLVAMPVALPILPIHRAIDVGLVGARDDWQEEIGWPELAGQVATVHRGLDDAQRSRAVIVGLNYGVAGAIDRYGPGLGLPLAYSPHNAYWWWRRPPERAAPVIVVGVRDRDAELDAHFQGCTRASTITNRLGVENHEAGAGIWLCRGTNSAWRRLWPELRRYG